MPCVQRMFANQSTANNAQPNNPLSESYQSYFTHNPVEGYIRNSPYDVVVPPNLALDQYVWQNVSKWPNHVAMVSQCNEFFWVVFDVVAVRFSVGVNLWTKSTQTEEKWVFCDVEMR